MNLSDDYIRGLIDGEGCFTFCSVPRQKLITDEKGTRLEKIKIPAFAIRMNSRDRELIEAIRDRFGLSNKVYQYRGTPLHAHKKSYPRGNQSVLIVRDLGSLKNKIIPFFYGRLLGYKGCQFMEWLEQIGSEPTVSDDYKILFRLYKCGWFDKNPKFLD